MLIILTIVVLICSYPLTISPANSIIESFTVEKIFPRGSKGDQLIYDEVKGSYVHSKPESEANKQMRKWLKNLSRFLICLSAAYFGIELSEVLDKFLGLMGAVFCAPLALMIPTFCHLKVVAKTRREKTEDLVIIFFSILAMLLCIVQTISSWK
mmetsp:Transcript_12477/g.20974  ORF Transcript_12477/g.20974 Transcript_12477/m.20974 type:complete len:154 (+) Transcript_12477:1714-2175(+)